MWFKNLQIYRLPAPWDITALALHEQLTRLTFQRCGSQDRESRGFVSPRGNDLLVHSVGGQWLMALGSEQRLLPASVVQQELTERLIKVEAEQGYRPGRKQQRELKERIIEELLPRAFTRTRLTWAWINADSGWLVVDASNRNRADEVIESLGKALDQLPVKRPHTLRSPVSCLSDWLIAGEAPAGFTIDQDLELKSVDTEKAAVRYVRHSLNSPEIQPEIQAHIAAGKLPTRLAMTWDDRLSFILTEDLEVKRLAFLDVVQDEVEKQAEGRDETFDTEFSLMSLELSRFLPDLLEALGGEKVDPAEVI